MALVGVALVGVALVGVARIGELVVDADVDEDAAVVVVDMDAVDVLVVGALAVVVVGENDECPLIPA